MNGGAEELRLLGEVEFDEDVYVILEGGIEHYHVVRRSDRRRIGTFRGSPTSMWLLEPETVTLDVFRSIVRSAIVAGVIVDTPSD